MERNPLVLQGRAPAAKQFDMVTSPLPGQQLTTGGRVVGAPKLIDQWVWDTEAQVLAGGETTTSYFTSNTYQTGALTGTIKDPSDYNMPGDGGQFPAPQSFAMTGIQVQILGTKAAGGARPTTATLQQFRSYSVLRFYQQNVAIWEEKCDRLPSPGFNISANSTAGVSVKNLGAPQILAYHKFGEVYSIPSGLNFKVELFTSSGYSISETFYVRIILAGKLSRSIG
jgi:hypothetical protein